MKCKKSILMAHKFKVGDICQYMDKDDPRAFGMNKGVSGMKVEIVKLLGTSSYSVKDARGTFAASSGNFFIPTHELQNRNGANLEKKD